MRITTRLTLEILDEIGEYRELSRESYEFSGPVALAKKGRGANANNTAFQQQQAQNYSNIALPAASNANKFYTSELNLTPGGMSSDAAAMYANDLNNINQTYNGLRQNLFASSGARGYGNAPSGFQSSSLNSLNREQGASQQSAYNSGQIQTQQERAQGAAGESQLFGTATQGELGNTNAANTSAYDQSRMGSTAGDILGGISAGLGLIPGIGGIVSGIQSASNLMKSPTNLATQNLPQSPDASSLLNMPGLNTYSPNAAKSNSSVGNY